MSPPALNLIGELAQHARGRTLMVAFGATSSAEPPRAGVAFSFGREFQEHPERSASWSGWCERPGRVLILLPPFAKASCTIPTSWEARRAESLAGGETELGRLLARERQHELRGSLVPFERVGGQVVTAGWRRHPASGLLVITALPLWSLVTLDHADACRSWVATLWSQAGTPLAEADVPAAPLRPLTKDEWALLLHLCNGPFPDREAALSAVLGSPVQRLEPERARAALENIEKLGLAEGGRLTTSGEGALRRGPYAAFARALRRNQRG